ncbi:mitochondrial chaperone BCS1 [Purpureocillium lavendulum]|uniref:Mitochondrial chaperone BCS1 n=1 Tax=Purpureocillium lavendulum TaxID=1247861 RepID=A0AB34G2Y0_9HYPO|nr:mitochondrial chaperone BCS1 [Purpureocillium lavendulum]
MRANSAVVTALAALAAFASAADDKDVIYTGPKAQDISTETWQKVLDSPTNSSTAHFTGFDITKAYPSSEQEGWQLKIGVKGGLDGDGTTGTVMSLSAPGGGKLANVSDTWHLCVYAFNVKVSSATSWGSGKKPSCKGLVANECIDQISKDAAAVYSSGKCPVYDTKPACLRDLPEQTAMALSLPARDISSVLNGNTSFFRRNDGAEKEAFETAAGQPMAVVTLWGGSGNSDKAPVAEVACVMPNAKEAASSSTRAVAFLGWSAVTLAVAAKLVM